jgi:hypothetical protein
MVLWLFMAACPTQVEQDGGTQQGTGSSSGGTSAAGASSSGPSSSRGPSSSLGILPVVTFALPQTVVPETQASPVRVELTRMGADLTRESSAVVVVSPSSTALVGVHFNHQPQSTFPTTGFQTLTFPALAAGATMQSVSFELTPVDARQPTDSHHDLLFSVTSATGATVPTPVPGHTVRFEGGVTPQMQDVDINGNPIPETVAFDAYNGITACEGFGADGRPTAGVPGAGGYSPCGSYRIPVGHCGDGMLNTNTVFGAGLTDNVNSVLDAYMFVMGPLRPGATYFEGNDIRFAQDKNTAFVIKFQTGGAGEYQLTSGLPAGAVGGLLFVFAQQPNRGTPSIRFAAVSSSPCDFRQDLAQLPDPCYRILNIAGGGNIIADIVPDGVSAAAGHCALRPNSTYYLSMRWEDPTTNASKGLVACRTAVGSPTGTYCGTTLGFH